MIKIEDHCVGCPTEMGCIGSGCPQKEVEVHYCDKCESELEDVYVVDGEELCEDCLKEMFKVEC